MTREKAGQLIGYVLLVALILGLPYLTASFVVWNMDASQWDTTARGLTVFGAFMLTCAYAATRLPSEQVNEEQR